MAPHPVFVTLLFALPFALWAAGHALLWKRDPRSALGWIGICLLVPFLGPGLYFLFGINRIRNRAQRLDRPSPRPGGPSDGARQKVLDAYPPSLHELVRVSDASSRAPIVFGNALRALENGDEAYPAMLSAIRGAERSLGLATYLMDADSVGREFIDELAAARARGVDVRVLLDGLGERYSRPPAGRLLEARGVPVARFLPPRIVPPALHLNLRNHRKILVADGRLAFTGGMNIGRRNTAVASPDSRVIDTHYRLEGPIVAQIEQIFLADWGFAHGSAAPFASGPLAPDADAAEVPLSGTMACRTLVDGPDGDLDRLITVQLGAIAAASRRVSIVTPYFIPPREYVGALRAAALRGVQVAVLIPDCNNLPYVDWASTNHLWELLKEGVRIFRQPGPFRHTKLLVVDGAYAQIGSANLDPRSLRLNFELVVEVFDGEFTAERELWFDRARAAAREVTLEEVDGRALPTRLRDSLAWLASPYL